MLKVTPSIINFELILADIEVIEKRLPKIEKKAQLKVEKDAVVEYEILKRIQAALLEGTPVRLCGLTKEEQAFIKHYNFLTNKPMLYIANVSEDDILEGNKYVDALREFAAKDKADVVVVSAKIEEELSELDEETKAEFLSDFGLEESGLDILIRKAYDLLGLKTFLTAGPDECRAWTFKNGMKAPECAGVIHSDFERGFIRAETYAFADLVQYGTPLKVREAGRVRLEGKDYVVQDGDIMLFRFNV